MAITALHSAATGLRALSQRIDVVANNLANAETTAFKRSRTNFEDLYYLELACQIQIAAQAGGEVVECAAQIAEHTAQQFDTSNDSFIHGRDWAALRRMLDRIDPTYAQ